MSKQLNLNRSIFLTGFMGSGKSTLGKKLAPLFQLPFHDLDDYIVRREGQSISAIFARGGEAAFRSKESYWLQQLLRTDLPAVVALGGGTVCNALQLQRIKDAGLLVYLHLPAAALAGRLQKNAVQRPLLNGLATEDLAKQVDTLLTARLPYYTQAHLQVNALNLTPQKLQHQICAFLEA